MRLRRPKFDARQRLFLRNRILLRLPFRKGNDGLTMRQRKKIKLCTLDTSVRVPTRVEMKKYRELARKGYILVKI